MSFQQSDVETREILKPLLSPVQYLKGVGPRRAALLDRLGIQTVYDLLWHLPRAYGSQRRAQCISRIQPGEMVAIQATVRSVHARKTRPHSRVRNIIEAVLDDGEDTITAVWFNQAYLKDKLHPGRNVRLFGKTGLAGFGLRMTSPEIEWIDNLVEEEEAGRIVPFYPLTEGLSQKNLRTIIAQALKLYVPPTLEFLPLDILAKHSLPTLGEALHVVHEPEPTDGAPTSDMSPDDTTLFDKLACDDPDSFRTTSTGAWIAARHRLIFEEFFHLRWLLAQSRSQIRTATGTQHTPPRPDPLSETAIEVPPQPGPETWPARYLQSLPFTLTTDQQSALRAIQCDMLDPSPMNRMLQGEVGSGKTVVAFYALILAAAGGTQAAMMVPTEILVEQHLHTFLRLKKAIPELSVATLRGSMGARDRRPILQALSAGSLHIVIGTHALFEEGIDFYRLGMVVIDEQHK
ncbi:MAG: DEAD/DEAH box helicase, partial [bacterium]